MGVRSRILATFVVGSLLLSGVLFFLTFTLTRSNLREREGELGLSNDLINETLNSVRASLILATIITVLVGLMLGIVSTARLGIIALTASKNSVASTRLQTGQSPPAFLALWVLFAPMAWMPALLAQAILSTQVGVVIVKLAVRMRS